VYVGRVEQTRDGLLLQLEEQRRFLGLSCAAFDAGDHAEAQRIATTLRVLLHQLGSSRALLIELGTRDQIGWLDTAGSLLPLEGSAQTPLVFVRAEERPEHSRPTWLPTLDAWDRRLQERPQLSPEVQETLARGRAEQSLRSRGRWLPFAEWWDADILRDRAGQNFTRADLVRALANTDGEASVDPSLHQAYNRLSRPSSAGWVMRHENSPDVPLTGPAMTSVRQIAFEVEWSLHRGKPPS
jgi:hypothetical protein